MSIQESFGERNHMEKQARKPLIIYHGPTCNDGFGAALAAYHVYGKDGADYLPMNYGKERDGFCFNGQPAEKFLDDTDLVTGRDVYILDFSFKWEQLQAIRVYASQVIMLDHHETAAKELYIHCVKEDLEETGFWTYAKDNLFIQFDNFRSGALQAWHHFHGVEETPRLPELLDAYDLWKWEDGDDADALNVAIQTFPREFEHWQDLLVEENLREVIARGKPVVSFIVERMNELEKHVQYVDIAVPVTELTGYKLSIINAPYFLASRLGNRIAKQSETGLACVYSLTNDEKAILSFRSTNGSAKKMAEYFGGGGHANAAGASVSLETLFKIISNKYDCIKDRP